MAYRHPSSPRRNPRLFPLPERTRIEDEVARMKETSHLRGLAATSRFVPPIRDISLHGFWDGYVGHAVDVKIMITIAARPNIRYVVIDASDELVEAAGIHSISRISDDPSKDANQDLSMPVNLNERIVYDKPKTWHGGDKNIPRHKRRSVHVGERSVYGTEDSFETSFGQPTGYRFTTYVDPVRSSEQAPYVYELAGDTLLASEAQRYMQIDEPACMGDAKTGLFVPRKRASPGKRSRGPVSLVHAFHESTDWEDSFTHPISSRPPTYPEHAGQHQSLADSVFSEQADDSSESSVLVSAIHYDRNKDVTPMQSAARQPPSAAGCTFSKDELKCLVDIRGGCNSPSPKVPSTERTVASDQLLLSDTSYFLPPSRADGSVKVPNGASLTESRKVRVRRSTPMLRSTERKDTRTRPRSLSRLRDDQGSLPENLMKFPSFPKNGSRLPRAGSPTKPKIKNGAASQKSSDAGSRSNKTHTTFAKIEVVGAQETRDPSAILEHTAETRDSTSSSTNCGVVLPREHTKDPSTRFLNKPPEDDDTERSPWAKPRNGITTGQESPQRTRIAASHNTPDPPGPPWLESNVDSSRHSLEDARSPFRVEPMKPYSNNLGGNLDICFPANVNPGLYAVKIEAKIYLTEPDSDGWRGFRVPGLPFLENSQPAGRVSLSVNGYSSFQFDYSPNKKFFTCGPNILVGSSHFGPSPLLRVQSKTVGPAKHEQMRVYQNEAVSPARCRRLLECLSLDDGTPNNDILVWLLKEIHRAGFEGSSEELDDLWFTRLDISRVKAAAGAILHGREKTASTKLGQAKESINNSNQANRTKRTEQYGLSSLENEQLTRFPAYFAGRAPAHDTSEVNKPSQLAWNFGLNVTRSISGMLQCRLNLEFRAGIKPLLTIDAREWRLELTLIDGRLATQEMLQTTEIGDLGLYQVKARKAEDTVKIELHYHELETPGGIKSPADGSRFSRPLPNVTDMTILGGSLTCNVDNAIIKLSEPNRGDVTWRPDTLDGRNSVTFSELCQDYRMYLLTSEKGAEAKDDWETLTDIDTVLDWTTPCPPSRRSSGAQRLAELQPDQETTSAQKLAGLQPHWKASLSPASMTEQSLFSMEHCGTQPKLQSIPRSAPGPADNGDSARMKNDRKMNPQRTLSRIAGFSADLCYRTFVFIGYVMLARLIFDVTLDYWARLDAEQGPRFCSLMNSLVVGNLTFPGFALEHCQIATSIVQNGTETNDSWDMNSIQADEVSGEGREVEGTGQVRGPSWRDVIDRALGWRELED